MSEYPLPPDVNEVPSESARPSSPGSPRQRAQARKQAADAKRRSPRKVQGPFSSPQRRKAQPAFFRQDSAFGEAEAAYGTAAPNYGTSSAYGEAPSSPTPGIKTPSPSDDVDMDQDGSTARTVLNAPALPKPPLFKGSTKAERRQFIRDYNTYIAQVNALQYGGSRPFIMPVNSCIEQSTKKRIALWDMHGRDYNSIREDEWIAWFMESYVENPLDLDVVKARLQTAITYDMTIIDAGSRIDKMLEGLTKVLDKDNQEWILYDEGEIVVKLITNVLKPQILKDAVLKTIKKTKNEQLRKDVFVFINWLRGYASTLQAYGDAELEAKKPAAVVTTDSRKPATGVQPASASRPSRQPAAVATQATPTTAPRAPSATNEPRVRKCLKCQSPAHHVKQCPGITEDEANRLLKAYYEARDARRAAVNSLKTRGSEPVRSSEGSIKPTRGTCNATIGKVFDVVGVLLDTGADVSLASKGLVEALIRANISVKLTTAAKPMTLQANGQHAPDVVVSNQVTLEYMELHASVGSVALRSLTVWMDESKSGVELLFGYHVMNALVINDVTNDRIV